MKRKKKNGKRIRYGESDFGVFRCISSFVAYSKMATMCVTVRSDVSMDEITSTQLIIIIDVECCH